MAYVIELSKVHEINYIHFFPNLFVLGEHKNKVFYQDKRLKPIVSNDSGVMEVDLPSYSIQLENWTNYVNNCFLNIRQQAQQGCDS